MQRVSCAGISNGGSTPRADSIRSAVARTTVIVRANPKQRRLAGKYRIATGCGNAQLEQVALRMQQRHDRHAGEQKR